MSGVGERLVVLVRHPETEANVQRRYAGSSESPYTERGRVQAVELGAVLSAWGPDEVYSSPRARALDVARLVAGESVQVREELAEMDFGPAELMTYDETDAAGLRIGYPGLAPVPGPEPVGESWADFSSRVSAIGALLAAGRGRTVVVAHGGVLRAMLASWLAFPVTAIFRLEVANAAHALVAFDDGHARLRSFGPTTPGSLGR